MAQRGNLRHGPGIQLSRCKKRDMKKLFAILSVAANLAACGTSHAQHAFDFSELNGRPRVELGTVQSVDGKRMSAAVVEAKCMCSSLRIYAACFLRLSSARREASAADIQRFDGKPSKASDSDVSSASTTGSDPISLAHRSKHVLGGTPCSSTAY